MVISLFSLAGVLALSASPCGAKMIFALLQDTPPPAVEPPETEQPADPPVTEQSGGRPGAERLLTGESPVPQMDTESPVPQTDTESPVPQTDTDKTRDDAQTSEHAGQPPDRKLKSTLDLSSPRATMRTFLVAAQEAKGDFPERIDDAVGCLDLLELEGEDRLERARQLAHRLHNIIARQDVKNLDDIPEQTDKTECLFFTLSPAQVREFEPGEDPVPKREIKLELDSETGEWRFTALTLASIPTLEKAAQKKAEQVKEVDGSIPVARRSPRATMETFLNAMNAEPKDLEQAALCLNPAGRERQAWEVAGQQLAHRLKIVVDKIALVVLAEIPDDPAGEQYAWYTSKTGNIVIGRVEEEKKPDDEWAYSPQKGEWRFTPQTLRTLQALYDELEDRELVAELRESGRKEELPFGLWLQRHMPQWSRSELLKLQIWQWFALVVLLPLGWVVQRLSALIATLLLRCSLRWRKIDIDRKVQQKALHSSGAVVTVLFWQYAVGRLAMSPEALDVLVPITKFALALTAIWVGYRFIDVLGQAIAGDKDVRLTRFDDVLIPLMRKILRVVVILAVVLATCQYYNWMPWTAIGALGIGGLALAFAAQDTLGNFFGSVMVLFDRPFGIGDWVVVGDVEGTVERVGFRSTRVRTFYNSIVTIPNSKTATTQVDNYGARTYRRIKCMLSLTYSTPPEKIDAFCEGIRELIRLHPYTRKDYYHVYFNKFASSSLDVLLYTFLNTPDWGTELRERHRLFIDILRLAQRLGVEFAFPTQTLHLERIREAVGEEVAFSKLPDETDPTRLGLDEAARLFEEAYGAERAYRPPVVISTVPRSKRSKPNK